MTYTFGSSLLRLVISKLQQSRKVSLLTITFLFVNNNLFSSTTTFSRKQRCISRVSSESASRFVFAGGGLREHTTQADDGQRSRIYVHSAVLLRATSLCEARNRARLVVRQRDNETQLAHNARCGMRMMRPRAVVRLHYIMTWNGLILPGATRRGAARRLIRDNRYVLALFRALIMVFARKRGTPRALYTPGPPRPEPGRE